MSFELRARPKQYHSWGRYDQKMAIRKILY